MKRLIAISNPRAAQAFIDYMAYRGIDIRMQEEEQEENKFYALWLVNAEDQIETEAELKAFLKNPAAEKYQAASWSMAESRTARFSYSKKSLVQLVSSQAGPVTIFVLVLAISIYLEQNFGNQDQMFNWLHYPESLKQYAQWWRPFSHALLHFSLTHLVFNLLWWFVLGGQIEKRLGSLKLLSLFLLAAWGSGFAQFWFEGPYFGGLSGVVYALMGYCWVLSRWAPKRGVFIENAYVGIMLVWLILGFFEPFGMAIANMAHLFGLLFGLLIGAIDCVFNQNKKEKP